MSQTPSAPAQIELLPPQLANQIAAGEVVERPASVVKELIENSIDAQADSIHIEIEQGGHKRILIRDSGLGIAKEQLELALSRHATSKIRNIDDLEAITSMGFRGEALASISSVSRLTLTSKPAGQNQAWQAKAEGMDMAVALSPAAHPNGTSIEVVDLFFNTPARRKFLRAQKTEFQHIEGIVRRVALAHPSIAFVLKHNGKQVFKWGAGDLATRVAAVCSAQYLQRMTPIDYRHEDMHLSGWCSKIGEGWQTNDQQFIFVNRRMIRDKLVLHAIRQAFEGMLPENMYPAYVLFLRVPAHDMDINVHPAKHEVRFHQARKVHDLIFQAISQAILTAQSLSEQTPSEQAPSVQQDASPEQGASLESASALATATPLDMQGTAKTHDYIRPLELKSSTHVAHLSSPERIHSGSAASVNRRSVGSELNIANQQNIAEAGKRYQELMQHSDEIHSTKAFLKIGNFVLFQQTDEAVVLPLTSVLRMGFETDIAQASTSQPLLMPVSVQHDCVSHMSALENLRAIGCIIDSRQQKYILKQVPSAIRALPWAHIFVRLLEQEQKICTETECLNMIAHYYADIADVSALSLSGVVSKIPADKLQLCLREEGKTLNADMLLLLTRQHQDA